MENNYNKKNSGTKRIYNKKQCKEKWGHGVQGYAVMRRIFDKKSNPLQM